MRFMMLRKADHRTEGGIAPGDAVLAAMATYVEQMADAGVLAGGNGLRPSATGARVRFAGGKATIVDGPFTETKELLAGYFIIEVPSKQDAIAWAKRWPGQDGDVEIELRQLSEPGECAATGAIYRAMELRTKAGSKLRS
jgi:hypothetical protein